MNPILKWVGGKSQMKNALLEQMPQFTGRYYEPFVGGGALFFELEPKQAVIGDLNSQLINFYTQVRDSLDGLKHELEVLEAAYNSADTEGQKILYYFLRDKYNACIANDILNVRSAALFLFLNRTCFNGLYRVNKKSAFNASWGKRKSVEFHLGNLETVSCLLSTASIFNRDFEETCEDAKAGDFVFLDPPYEGLFCGYQKDKFSGSGNRLFDLYERLTHKGVYCMLTNTFSPEIREMFSDYSVTPISVHYNISRDAGTRSGKTEALVCNWITEKAVF